MRDQGPEVDKTFGHKADSLGVLVCVPELELEIDFVGGEMAKGELKKRSE